MSKNLTTIVLGVAISCVYATHSTANTFSTSVDVTKVQTPLTIEQQTAMVLPDVRVGKNNRVGSVICTTNTGAQPSCTGQAKNGVFIIKGVPFSAIEIRLPQMPLRKNGLSFRVFETKRRTTGQKARLGRDGSYTLEVLGELTLEDKNLSAQRFANFDFEVMAVYD